MRGAGKTIGSGIRPRIAQELRQMLCDGGIGRVIQAYFHERGTALTLRSSIGGNLREESFEEKIADFFACDLTADGSTDQARAAAENGQRLLFGRVRVAGKQHLFCSTALLPQRMELHGVELGALLRK